MPKKRDIKQIDNIAKEFKMTQNQRQLFGEFLEEEKELGYKASLNERGDFTYQELRQKAIYFLDL